MADHQARSSRDDVYDHDEHEEPRSGRRRRPVADWGVGEDMFEAMPRNRFSRTAEAPPRERRFAREDERRQRPAGESPEAAAPEAPEAEAPEREEPAADVPRGGVADGRRTLRIGSDEDVPSEIAAITADRDIPPEEVAAPVPTGDQPERRTVKIGGHPEGSLEAARYQRDRARRPRRTAHERVGHRPDRIAMWAFALGLLLILIAVLTAM
jgi:hypothetical protein